MSQSLQTVEKASARSNSARRKQVVADRRFITGLSRGLRVLEAFRPGDEFVTNADLAKRTGLPKPTITRMTYTLQALGYIERAVDGRGYRLNPRVLTLGQPILLKLRIRQVARPLMQELAEATEFSVALGIRDGLDMIFIERARAGAVPTLPQDIGSHVPIPSTSMGRAYLAGLKRTEREMLLERLSRVGSKEQWLNARAAIDRELERYRTHGYCFGRGEWKAHACGVSVPIVLRDDSVLSLNCGGLRTKMTDRRLGEIGERLKAMAEQILSSQAVDR